MDPKLRSTLVKEAESTIVFLVLDGLGGLPREAGGPTELEQARTPNLDRLAGQSLCGLSLPIAPGITPGSGPAHLGLFGYDPVAYAVGRGVLAALGTGHDLAPGEVAIRGNFCTVDGQGLVTDRRAGRIPTDKTAELCDLISGAVQLEGGSYRIAPVRDYRFLLILSGEGLSGEVADTDPQETGKPPLAPKATAPEGTRTAELAAQFLDKASRVIRNEHPANMMLLRGFSTKPDWPGFRELYGLRAAAVAHYPMYRGVARLVGMEVLEPGPTFADQIETVRSSWEEFDFFFIHVKPTDSAGEDGDFDRKVALIEGIDAHVPEVEALEPDVLVVTGDHSTPAVMKYHSWHPVPVLLWSKYCRPDRVMRFGERDLMAGGLGPRLPALDLMPLALANAGRLEKFGA